MMLALSFLKGFYSAFFAGEKVEEAFRLGCNAIGLASRPGSETPVLYKDGKRCEEKNEYDSFFDLTFQPTQKLCPPGMQQLYS